MPNSAIRPLMRFGPSVTGMTTYCHSPIRGCSSDASGDGKFADVPSRVPALELSTATLPAKRIHTRDRRPPAHSIGDPGFQALLPIPGNWYRIAAYFVLQYSARRATPTHCITGYGPWYP